MSIEKIVIIGSGPAGWTSAIYAARANLDPLLYEGQVTSDSDMIPGGQLMSTTEVENFPGFPEGIDGPALMDSMRKQAERFEVRIVGKNITKVDFSQRPFTLHVDDGSTVQAHAVIVATGATANWLNIESEQHFRKLGLGVTACATCDGAFPRYRNHPIAVVGGGDSAMEEALYLTKFASMVHVIHRRDELRASKVMQERVLNHEKITVEWNSVIDEVLGTDTDGVNAIRLKDTKSGELREVPVTGVFLAIGHTPNVAFLEGQLDLTEKNYIRVMDPPGAKTSVEGVFAVGDVADADYRQAITAAGMGCMGAIDAERWLANQGID